MTSKYNNVVSQSAVLSVRLEEPAHDSVTVASVGGTTSVSPDDISEKYFLKRAGSGQYWSNGNFSASLYEDILLTIFQNPVATVLHVQGRERHFFHPQLAANQSLAVIAQLVFLASDGSRMASVPVTLTRLRGEVTSDTNLRQLSITTTLDVSGTHLPDVARIEFLGQVLEKVGLGWTGYGRLDSENVWPPSSIFTLASPVEGTANDQAKLKSGKTIEGAAKLYKPSCSGGQTYPDNCAHFLSDALIFAGFSNIAAPHSCVTARCDKPGCTAAPKRPIRAKDIRCWFKENAKTMASSVERNSGFWAVYQERQGDGQGHVVILDANAWKFYGTGWFEMSTEDNWKHEYYQW